MKIKFCKYKSEVLNESDLKYTECLIKVTSSIPLLMALPLARGKKQCLPLIVREQRQWIKISYQKESYDLCIFNEQRKLRLLQNVNRQRGGCQLNLRLHDVSLHHINKWDIDLSIVGTLYNN